MFFTSTSSKHCPLVKPKVGYEKVLDWSKICMCQLPTMLLYPWFFKDITRSWNKDASRCWKIKHYFLYVAQLCKKLLCLFSVNLSEYLEFVNFQSNPRHVKDDKGQCWCYLGKKKHFFSVKKRSIDLSLCYKLKNWSISSRKHKTRVLWSTIMCRRMTSKIAWPENADNADDMERVKKRKYE